MTDVYLLSSFDRYLLNKLAVEVHNLRFFLAIHAFQANAELPFSRIGPDEYIYSGFATHSFYQRIISPVVQVNLPQAVIADPFISIRIRRMNNQQASCYCHSMLWMQ